MGYLINLLFQLSIVRRDNLSIGTDTNQISSQIDYSDKFNFVYFNLINILFVSCLYVRPMSDRFGFKSVNKMFGYRSIILFTVFTLGLTEINFETPLDIHHALTILS